MIKAHINRWLGVFIMARQAAVKSILSGLELSDTRRAVFTDRAAERRSKLLGGLDQQKAAAAATQAGKEYFGK